LRFLNLTMHSMKALFIIISISLPIFCSSLLAQPYVVEKLPESINTKEFDEVTPIVTHDGGTVFFTRVGSGDFNKTILIDGKDVSDDYMYRDYLANLRAIYSEIAGRQILGNPEKSDFNQDIWYAESREREFDHLVHPPTRFRTAFARSLPRAMPLLSSINFPKMGA
jgi:hypothetical protein